MHFQFLGTGNARQVPCYGCDCPACQRAQIVSSFRRSPCSAKIEIDGKIILLDGGQTNLTERFAAGSIHTILLTHYHMDHVQGLFHLRWGKGKTIPVIGPDDLDGCDDLFKHPGLLEFLPSPKLFTPFQVLGIEITPLPLNHSKPTVGYHFDFGQHRLAYLTDTLGLPAETLNFLKNKPPHSFIIDCSYPPKENPKNHNSLNEAIDIIAAIKPQQSYLTHIGHDLDAYFMGRDDPLPHNISLANDQQKISLIT